MTDVLIWVGPVAKDNLFDPPNKPTDKPQLPTSWEIKVCNNEGKGGGSDAFKAWALGLGENPLDKIVGKGATRIVMAGFSAAHGAIDVILQRRSTLADRRLVGLLALDAYYTAWRDTTPKVGYMNWLRLAIERGTPAWLTTSSHHPTTHPGGSESIGPLAKALELTTADLPAALAVGDLPTPKVLGRNNVRWLDYGAALAHKDHVHKLARPALANGPWFTSEPPMRSGNNARAAMPNPPAPPQSNGNAALGIGIALGLAGLTYLVGRR